MQIKFGGHVVKSFEEQYIKMLKTIITNAVDVPNHRTGVSTIALFDYKLTVNEGEFPFSTIRPAHPRLAFEELWLFLRGDTNTKLLEEKGIGFWKGNTSREFLDSRGLHHLPEGDLGAAYSKQFRNFGDSYDGGDYTAGVDQVEKLYLALAKDRYSRRLVTSLWNPPEEDNMVLTACWWCHQFVVLPSPEGDTLHLKLINRSLDALFGCIFAVQQYRLYQIALAKLFGMRVGKLSCDLTHIHLYENQIEYTTELLRRPYNFDGCYDINRIKINKDLVLMDDLLELTWEDFQVSVPTVNVSKFETARPEMVA